MGANAIEYLTCTYKFVMISIRMSGILFLEIFFMRYCYRSTCSGRYKVQWSQYSVFVSSIGGHVCNP